MFDFLINNNNFLLKLTVLLLVALTCIILHMLDKFKNKIVICGPNTSGEKKNCLRIHGIFM
jgi:hypothetical protein